MQFRPWPQWLLRFGYKMVDLVIDGLYAKKLNAVRCVPELLAEAGLGRLCGEEESLDCSLIVTFWPSLRRQQLGLLKPVKGVYKDRKSVV